MEGDQSIKHSEFSPILCKERMDRLKSDIDNGLESARKEIHSCHEAMSQRIAAEKDLAIAKSDGHQRAIMDALGRIESTLDSQTGQIEDLEEELEIIKEKLPTDAIKRLCALEDWRRYVIGGFSVVFLFVTLLWLFVEHVLNEKDAVVKAAQSIIEVHAEMQKKEAKDGKP